MANGQPPAHGRERAAPGRDREPSEVTADYGAMSVSISIRSSAALYVFP